MSARMAGEGGFMVAQSISDGAAWTNRRDFIVVPLYSLRLDRPIDFDLFLPARSGRAPMLYRKKGAVISKDDRAGLQRTKIFTLLVKPVDRDAYRVYLGEHLVPLLKDDKTIAEEKCAVLYDTAVALVRDMIEHSDMAGAFRQVMYIVDTMVSYMLSEPRSFRLLISKPSIDYFVYTHSVNVFIFSVFLAQRAGVLKEDIADLARGALFHDIGKGKLDETILLCKGKLSDAQWDEMRRHTLYSVDLLSSQGEVNQVALDVVRHHHEKLTGRGYPDGLLGDKVSVYSRICCIADIFDALTTDRNHQRAMDSFPSLKLMKAEMGDDIDASLFRAFVEVMGSK